MLAAGKSSSTVIAEEASAASELARCDAARGDEQWGPGPASEERAHVLLVAHNTTERLLLKHMCQAGIRTLNPKP